MRTGLAQDTCLNISVLQDAGFVERRVPVTAAPSSRLGRYHIVDPYLRFYYRFLATRQAQLALENPTWPGRNSGGIYSIYWHAYVGRVVSGMGAACWCAGQSGQHIRIRWAAPDTGGASRCGWHQHDGEEIVLGECKWQTAPVGRRVLRI